MMDGDEDGAGEFFLLDAGERGGEVGELDVGELGEGGLAGGGIGGGGDDAGVLQHVGVEAEDADQRSCRG